jgi:hypothetical protein
MVKRKPQKLYLTTSSDGGLTALDCFGIEVV